MAAAPIDVTALEQRLRQQGLRRLVITWVNHAGATLAKVVPLAAVGAAGRLGVGFSPVSDAFRSDGVIDGAHRLAQPDGDLRLVADLEAITALEPASGWAWAPGSRRHRDGTDHAGDQRAFCQRQQQQLEQAGVVVQAGFELEWMVGLPEPEAPGLEPAMAGGPYGADRLVEGLDYAAAITDACDASGLGWLQFHPEYGAGQFELSLAPGTPLQAADHLVLAKLLVQRVSHRFGWRCSFSPKPMAQRVGNGGHLHVSLCRHGVPLLQGGAGPGGLTEAGSSLLGGLLEHLPALLALACNHPVSYRRLAPGSWSAPHQAWGIENREAALRLIPAASDGAAAHLEIKVADLTANPYLLLGAVLATVADGLMTTYPLPAPISGDPALLGRGAPPRLPSSLAAASRAFAASRLLRSALGEELHGSLLDSQQAEVRRAEELDEEALLAASRWWPIVGCP